MWRPPPGVTLFSMGRHIFFPFFFHPRTKGNVKLAKQQKLFQVTLQMPLNETRTVSVKAATREVAERRAMKRNPKAIRVIRNAE